VSDIATLRMATLSAAAPEPALLHRVSCLLALAEELHVAHDRLTRMMALTMGYVVVVVGDPDHEACRAHGPPDEVADLRQERGQLQLQRR